MIYIQRLYSWLIFPIVLLIAVIELILRMFRSLFLNFHYIYFWRPIDTDNAEINNNLDNPKYVFLVRILIAVSNPLIEFYQGLKNLKDYDF